MRLNGEKFNSLQFVNRLAFDIVRNWSLVIAKKLLQRKKETKQNQSEQPNSGRQASLGRMNMEKRERENEREKDKNENEDRDIRIRYKTEYQKSIKRK